MCGVCVWDAHTSGYRASRVYEMYTLCVGYVQCHVLLQPQRKWILKRGHSMKIANCTPAGFIALCRLYCSTSDVKHHLQERNIVQKLECHFYADCLCWSCCHLILHVVTYWERFKYLLAKWVQFDRIAWWVCHMISHYAIQAQYCWAELKRCARRQQRHMSSTIT